MARLVLFPIFTLLFFSNLSVAAEPLRILTENWPPMAYEENGVKTGMAWELTKLLQQKIPDTKGRSAPIEIMPFARGFHTVTTRPNTILFTVARTPERDNLFHFLGPISNGEVQLFAKPNSALALQKVPLNKQHLVAALRGSVHETVLRQHGFKNIVLVNDPITNIKLLMSGRVDLICDDIVAIDELTRRAGFPATTLPKIFSFGETKLYYAISKGTRVETLKNWKNALEEVKRNGEFKTLYSKWFKNLTPSLEVVLTNYDPQKTSLKKEARPLGIAKVK